MGNLGSVPYFPLVFKDLLDGYVSPEKAAADYGVVLELGRVDEKATENLRREKRTARENDAFLNRIPDSMATLIEGDLENYRET